MESRKLTVALVGAITTLLVFVGNAMAQSDYTNPFQDANVDAVVAITEIIAKFQSVWYLGAAFVIFFAVNILRGKIKIGTKALKVPWFSKWFDEIDPRAKFWTIIILASTGTAIAALGTIDGEWNGSKISSALLSGFISGVTLGLAAMGVKSGAKVHRRT